MYGRYSRKPILEASFACPSFQANQDPGSPPPPPPHRHSPPPGAPENPPNQLQKIPTEVEQEAEEQDKNNHCYQYADKLADNGSCAPLLPPRDTSTAAPLLPPKDTAATWTLATLLRGLLAYFEKRSPLGVVILMEAPKPTRSGPVFIGEAPS